MSRLLFSQTVYRIVTRVYKYVHVHPTPRVIYDTRVHDVTRETTAGTEVERGKGGRGRETEREREREKAYRERSGGDGYRWMAERRSGDEYGGGGLDNSLPGTGKQKTRLRKLIRHRN